MPSACPFCNSVLPSLAAPPEREKLPCPRCGEPVPATAWPIDVSQGENTQFKAGVPGSRASASDLVRTQAPGKRQTLLAILGVMLVMAVIGLSYALWTKGLRRSRDPKQPETLQPVVFRRPLELNGLGYLPPGCQIVVGLQIAELLEDKTGKQLLDPPRPPILDWVLKQIPRTTGLTLEELDHILAAVSFDHFPQLVLVVKTRLKVSLERIAEAQPTRSTLYRERALYEFSLKPYGEALVWCVEDHTLLYVIRPEPPTEEHLKGLSIQERPVRDLLSAPLYEILDQRLSRRQFLWAVGRLDQLGPVKELAPLILGARADLRSILDVERFGLGLAPVQGLTLTGHFLVADTKKADRLKTLLESIKIEGARSQKVVAAQAEDPEQWLTWQVQGDAGAMRALLNRNEPAKK